MDYLEGCTELASGINSTNEFAQSGEKANVGEIRFYKDKNGSVKSGVIIDKHLELTEEYFFESEEDIPEVGDKKTILGVECTVTEARIIYSNEDCNRVRLSGRSVNFS